jgi:hypothetical protein
MTTSSWLELIHHEDVNEFQSYIKRQYKQNSPEIKSELRMRHKLGHWVWIMIKGQAV